MVFSGTFDSQPRVFTHLLTACPELDLGHVEVIQEDDPLLRLGPYFDAATADQIIAARGADDTLALVLPAAYSTLDCPFDGSDRLRPLGAYRGTVPRMVATEKPR